MCPPKEENSLGWQPRLQTQRNTGASHAVGFPNRRQALAREHQVRVSLSVQLSAVEAQKPACHLSQRGLHRLSMSRTIFFCSLFRVLITVLCIKIFQRKKQSSIFFKTYLGCHFYEAYDRHGVAQNSLLARTFWKVVPAVASPPTPGRTAYCAFVVFSRQEVTQSARRVFTALVGLCSGVCSTSS